MKKIAAILLVLTLFLAMIPSAMAIGRENVASEIEGKEFDNVMVVPNMSNNMIIKNCTFKNGAYLYIGDSHHGKTVTIENCTFIDNPTTGYACTVRGASEVELINNTVKNCVRGFNIYSFGDTEVKAYGNNIEITDRELGEKYVNKIGIQFAGIGWDEEKTDISGNTFKNAYMAVRLHDTFKGVVDLGKNIYEEVGYPIGIDPDVSEANEEALKDALRSVTQLADTDITAEADPTFIVTIPEVVDFGKIYKDMEVQEKDFDISVSNALIEPNAKITVSCTSEEFIMKDGSEEYELEFSLREKEFVFNQGELDDGAMTLSTIVSCDPAKLIVAGTYKGSISFEISYN